MDDGTENHFDRGIVRALAHQNRSDFCDLQLRCPSRTPEIARFLRQEKAMLHCDLRVRCKVASDLRFRAAISESKTPSFCGISGDLAPSTRKSLAIAIVRFWCAKVRAVNQNRSNSSKSKPQLKRTEANRGHPLDAQITNQNRCDSNSWKTLTSPCFGRLKAQKSPQKYLPT